MADIQLSKLNESLLFVDGNPRALSDLSSYFKVRAPNYRWHPKYKAGFWDGFIYPFSTDDHLLAIGLVEEVRKFCRKGGYTLSMDWDDSPEKIELADFERFVEELDVQLPEGADLRNYQLASVWDAITKRRISIEVPTSGGKTVISYIMARWFMHLGLKSLIIVPTTTLVEQTYGDWYDYGWDELRDHVHKIYSGQKKHFEADITISTWQSLYTDQSIFEQFDVLIIDEAHGAKAVSLKNISRWCCNAAFRIGMSGTYPSDEGEERADYINIVGALGPIKTYTSYQEMEDNGWIPRLEIISIILRYQKPICEQLANEIGALRAAKAEGEKADPFNVEIDYVHNIPQRNEFLAKLIANACVGNTMVLFTKKEKHGWPLKEYLEEYFKGKKQVIYIDGDVDTMVRNNIRALAEKRNDLIILASYGTFSTGISIKNLHNVIFASGYKAKIKILQSIGRGLRKLPGKEVVKIYDLVDDCSIKRKDAPGYVNYSFRHFQDRVKIYESKGFRWKSIRYKF